MSVRLLQHARNGLDLDSEDGVTSLLFVYMVSFFMLMSVLALSWRFFLQVYLCRVCCNREPPFDPIAAELAWKKLTDPERAAVRRSVVAQLGQQTTAVSDDKETSLSKTVVSIVGTTQQPHPTTQLEPNDSPATEPPDTERGLELTTVTKALPKQEQDDSIINDDETDHCPICLGSLQHELPTAKSSHCQHVFHAHCITQWLNSVKDDKGNIHDDCPVCRLPILTAEDLWRAALDNGQRQDRLERARKRAEWQQRWVCWRKT